MSTTAVNPFLAGNFAPVQDEITADELTVIGELPADLSGMFVRIQQPHATDVERGDCQGQVWRRKSANCAIEPPTDTHFRMLPQFANPVSLLVIDALREDILLVAVEGTMYFVQTRF
jgi:hypothetical protein